MLSSNIFELLSHEFGVHVRIKKLSGVISRRHNIARYKIQIKELFYEKGSLLLPWADGLFRYADDGLGWDLNVGFLKVINATGIHDNNCNSLVLHHVKEVFS